MSYEAQMVITCIGLGFAGGCIFTALIYQLAPPRITVAQAAKVLSQAAHAKQRMSIAARSAQLRAELGNTSQKA